MNSLTPYIQLAKKPSDIRVGDTVRVHQNIKEENKTRVQVFEGLIIARKHGSEPGATITVRKISLGVGVEKIFPLYLPTIEKIDVTKRARVRRAKLYYLRRKTATQTRKKLKTKELAMQGQEILATETLSGPSREIK